MFCITYGRLLYARPFLSCRPRPSLCGELGMGFVKLGRFFGGLGGFFWGFGGFFVGLGWFFGGFEGFFEFD